MSWLNRAQQLLIPDPPLRQDEDLASETDSEGSDNSLRLRSHTPEIQETPETAPVRMVNYDSTTGEDADGALEKACHHLRGYGWEPNDLDFYFNQVEIKMRSVGVQKNYTKMLVLTTILPPNVREEVKPILRMQESEFAAGALPYKLLKDEVLKIFKPPQEANFERAMSRILSGKPSQLARQLVNDLCKHKLRGCCCSTFIVGQWKRQLPTAVKNSIAGLEFNAANFDALEILKATKADALNVVVQIDRKLDLRTLDLVWDLSVCVVVLS